VCREAAGVGLPGCAVGIGPARGALKVRAARRGGPPPAGSAAAACSRAPSAASVADRPEWGSLCFDRPGEIGGGFSCLGARTP
jgi:hypothetical protein